MRPRIIKIRSVKQITHDVLQITTERSAKIEFTPGQAAEISINKGAWKNEKRPFTFTCLPDNTYLEFTIKTYPSHNGVTKQIMNLKVNDELILHDVFGVIAYRGEGVFIAGGAGVTPFISIFRYLKSINNTGNNKLIFANKTVGDIILADEFKKSLDRNFINILSDEKVPGYDHGLITEDFLKPYIDSAVENVYICGPLPMMNSVEEQLSKLKIDKKQIIKEAF